MKTPYDDGLAVRALNDKVQQPNMALVIAAEHLEMSARQLSRGMDVPQDSAPELPASTVHFLFSAAYGAIAFLLHRLHEVDGSAASDAAWDLHEMCEAGEPLASWVSEELAKLGLDAGALEAEPRR